MKFFHGYRYIGFTLSVALIIPTAVLCTKPWNRMSENLPKPPQVQHSSHPDKVLVRTQSEGHLPVSTGLTHQSQSSEPKLRPPSKLIEKDDLVEVNLPLVSTTAQKIKHHESKPPVEQGEQTIEVAQQPIAAPPALPAESKPIDYKLLPAGSLEREKAKLAHIKGLSEEEYLKERAEKKTLKNVKTFAEFGAGGLGVASTALLTGLTAFEATGITDFIPEDSSGQPGQTISINISGDTTIGSSSTPQQSGTGASSSDVIALIDE